MALRYLVVFIIWTVGFSVSAQISPDFPGPSNPASTHWLSTENTVVTHRADLQRVIEFSNEFPTGTVLVVDQPAIYPWQLQSLDSMDDNFISVVTCLLYTSDAADE